MYHSEAHRRRVLVADDNAATLSSLGTVLSRWGFVAVPARNGTEALEALLGENAPRVALLDWNMPQLDGLAVCRRVRELQPLEPPFLILLTGRGGHEDLIAGLEGGADEYLPKPVDPAELRVRLNAAWRIVDLQDELARRVRMLEAVPPPYPLVTEAQAMLKQTLRLCIGTFEEALTCAELPHHLAVAMKSCRELCLEALSGETVGEPAT